jgi:integrase
MEVGILRRILKRARRWHLFAEDIQPLPERRNVGRALQHAEKLRLLKIAASRPEWQIVSLAATLALNTTMRACEIRGLQWRDVDFAERILTIRHSKTEAGERVIPLNTYGWAAVLELRKRAKLLFESEPKPDFGIYSLMVRDKAPWHDPRVDRGRPFRSNPIRRNLWSLGEPLGGI